MPIYEYEHDADHVDNCCERFELLQSMSDPPLDRCPRCSRPCHRVISSFATLSGGGQGTLSPKNLERLGFTQFKRAGDGRYEKTFGKGPDVISK